MFRVLVTNAYPCDLILLQIAVQKSTTVLLSPMIRHAHCAAQTTIKRKSLRISRYSHSSKFWLAARLIEIYRGANLKQLISLAAGTHGRAKLKTFHKGHVTEVKGCRGRFNQRQVVLTRL